MICRRKPRPTFGESIIALVFFLLSGGNVFAQADPVFAFRLSTQPFSTLMCKKIRPEDPIRIGIAHHRDLIVRHVPNQFVPTEFEEARKKSYVHYITLEDLTNGVINRGAIAFNEKYAVIFSEHHPQGISREEFVGSLPTRLAPVANQALNTFLRLHKILNAAIDGCRPYPSQVTYGTDDEFDKIEAGRLAYRDLTQHYNAHPSPEKNLVQFERGTSGGFYDPRTAGERVSYHAANPLYFYRTGSTPYGRKP